jgi:rubrerythrin
MKEFKNINDILDFAIAREQSAVDFYTGLYSKVENEEMKETFLRFAKHEMGHKALLMKVKKEGVFTIIPGKITDIKIADYIVAEETEPEKLSYPDALVLAMKRERSAYDLYKKLSISTDNPIYTTLFEDLANQELAHKNYFEREYDDWLSKEN